MNCFLGERDPHVCPVQAPAEHLAAGYHRRRIDLNHVALRATSPAQVDEVRRWLRDGGYPLLDDERYPFATEPGYHAVFCEDPDRIKLEVVAPSDG